MSTSHLCLLILLRRPLIFQQHHTAFFKPAITTDTDMMRDVDSPRINAGTPNNRLLSPVLGTEALYKQAGWISPNATGDAEVIITTTEDEEDDEEGPAGANAPRRVLAVHETNKKYQTNQFTRHSLQLSSTNDGDNDGTEDNGTGGAATAKDDKLASLDDKKGDLGGSKPRDGPVAVDGLGTARVATVVVQGREDVANTIEGATSLAKTNAERIRKAQEEHGMMGFIPDPTTADDMEEDVGEEDDGDDEGDDDDVEGGGDKKSQKGDLEQEFNIPRSMRDIYRISNRNRRKKKGGSVSPSAAELNEKENSELAKADEVLRSRNLEGGGNYYDEIMGHSASGGGGSPKRQRTKSTTSVSSNEDGTGVGHDSGNISRDDDIALMQEMGWISGKDEVDAMTSKQRERQTNSTPASGGDDNGDDSSVEENAAAAAKGGVPKPFDYSNVGAIGALSATPSNNPFFAGAAVAGGTLNQSTQKSGGKKQNSNNNSSHRGGGGGKQNRRGGPQVERPERRGDGRSQVYKKK